MFESFNQPVLREEVKTMLQPLITEISNKLSRGGLTNEEVKDTLKEILKDPANQTIFKNIKSVYPKNIQLAYKHILDNVSVTTSARKVIESVFKKNDSAIALAFGKEYCLKNITEPAKPFSPQLPGFLKNMGQEPPKWMSGPFAGMWDDASRMYELPFKLVNNVSQTVRTAKSIIKNTAEVTGKVATKVSNVFTGNNRTPPTTPTTP
jgi:hypothetical protein